MGCEALCPMQEAEEELRLQGASLPRLWSVGQALDDVGPSVSEAGQVPGTWPAAHSAQVGAGAAVLGVSRPAEARLR